MDDWFSILIQLHIFTVPHHYALIYSLSSSLTNLGSTGNQIDEFGGPDPVLHLSLEVETEDLIEIFAIVIQQFLQALVNGRLHLAKVGQVTRLRGGEGWRVYGWYGSGGCEG